MWLEPRQPFDLQRTLRLVLSPPALLNGRKFPPLLDNFDHGEYRRVVEVHGEPVLYGVSDEKRDSKPGLRVRILKGPGNPETLHAVRSLVGRQFSTDLDLSPFYRLASGDPALSRLVRHFAGMRIPQSATVFETVISAILEQQVNLSFAHKVKQALIETYGEHVEFEGRSYNEFPEPAALAILTPRQLRRLQISGPKARYIIAIARSTLDGS